jgi:hypothetical protein
MKKTLFTFGAVAAFVASACGQAEIALINPLNAGFNTATTNPLDSPTSPDWYTGDITLQVYTIPAAGNYSLATTINNYAANPATAYLAISLVVNYFTHQNISSQFGSLNTEAFSQTLSITDGWFPPQEEGYYYVGTASSLSQNTPVFFALVAETPGGVAGALVLDESSSGYTPSPGGIYMANEASSMWPDQNLLLPLPEPATLALAGLGGLSMLFLRRLRAQD